MAAVAGRRGIGESLGVAKTALDGRVRTCQGESGLGMIEDAFKPVFLGVADRTVGCVTLRFMIRSFVVLGLMALDAGGAGRGEVSLVTICTLGDGFVGIF